MIRQIIKEDLIQYESFLSYVLKDTYEKEGVGHLVDEIKAEVQHKIDIFYDALLFKRPLLLLLENDRIIGVAGCVACSDFIKTLAPELTCEWELGTVYIHPDHQNKGNSKRLLKQLLIDMKTQGITSYCLDSGFTIAKEIWTKVFGDPYKIIKDYWAEGCDHYIWYIKNI